MAPTRTTIVLLLAAVVLFVEVKAKSKWLLLEVTEHGDVALKAAKDSDHPPSICKGHPAEPNNHVTLTYTLPVSGEECVVRAPDPRRQFHDHEKESGKWGGGVYNHKKISFAVTVHSDVSDFHTFDYKNPHVAAKRHYVTQDHYRAYQTMATVTIDESAIQMTPLQIAGPLQQQKNIVFISSGYTAAQQSKFDSDVRSLLDFTQVADPTTSLSSQPYRRYFSTMNFFKVWLPSVDVGASHPLPAGSGAAVNNNLDCSYGSTSSRILVCNRDKVLLAGSHAPPSPNDVIYMVLVNDVTFGGTGGAGVCTTYTGDSMKVIFIHEIGHAGSALSDEYDYGYSEPDQVPMKNCHWSNQNTPWDRWIFASILPQPTPVCTYSNYYKPTPGACLMESNQPSYCPVCASSVLGQLYDHGLNLASPRFPSQYETVYIELGASSTLYINSRIPYLKDETGDFSVSWSVVGYPDTAAATHAFTVGQIVNGSGFVPPSAGDYVVNCTIEDRTNMLLDYDRQSLLNRNGNNATALHQITQFKVKVYNKGDAAASACQNKQTIFGDSYCAVCDSGHESDCNRSYSAIPLQVVVDVDSKLTGLQGWLLGVGGLFIALGALIFILIWRMMALHAEHNPREILPLNTTIVVIRVVLLVLQVALLLGAVACIVFSVYMYGQLSVFGRTILLGIIASSVVVWFASFIGFCAAYYKNRAVLFVNFILLLLLFGCSLLFTTLLLYMLYHIDDKSVMDQLNGEWKTAVQNDAKSVCTLQSILDCSGFNSSCYTLAFNPAGSTNCPSNCEIANQNGNPCFLRIRDFVQSKFGTASIGGILLSVFILATMVLDLVLGCSIKSRRNYIHKERRRRHDSGESTLTPEEIAMIRREFNKVDKDGSGDISRQEFGQFYNAVMGVVLSPRELEEYFDKLDADGNGVLSFEEFIKVYVPQKEKSRKNLAKTKSMIYGTGQSIHSATPAEAAMTIAQQEEEAAARAQTTQSQAPGKRHQAHEMELDLALDEDLHVDLSPEEAARAQEERAKEEAARVAQAQAERQRRLKEDRPSNLDADLVLDDMSRAGGTMDSTNNMQMNLEIDLDNEQFE